MQENNHDHDHEFNRRNKDEINNVMTFVKGIVYVLLFVSSGFTVYFNVILGMQEIRNDIATSNLENTHIVDKINTKINTIEKELNDHVSDSDEMFDSLESDIKETGNNK